MPLLYDGRERLDWRKAGRSMNNGNCAEVATAIGAVAVRDSKDPHGPVLRYSLTSWHSFLAAAKKGYFDELHYSSLIGSILVAVLVGSRVGW
jgi:hypothetical protein